MQINNIQGYNRNRVSFGSKIFKTNCIKEAIDYAKNSATLNEKNEFYNSLSMIFNDDNIKTFKMSVPKYTLTGKLLSKYKFNIDKKVVKFLTYEMDENLTPFENCLNSLKHFIIKWYGKDASVALSKARLPHVKRYQELVKTNPSPEILSKQLKCAHMDIDRQIDVIMLQSRFGLKGE